MPSVLAVRPYEGSRIVFRPVNIGRLLDMSIYYITYLSIDKSVD